MPRNTSRSPTFYENRWRSMKAVSIKLRATDADNSYVILAYSLTNPTERGEKEWEHMSIIACGIFACCRVHMSFSLSLSFGSSFRFHSEWTVLLFLCPKGFERNKTGTIILRFFERFSLCTQDLSHTVTIFYIISAKNYIIEALNLIIIQNYVLVW